MHRAEIMRQHCAFLVMAEMYLWHARHSPGDRTRCKSLARFWLSEARQLPPVRLP